MNYAGKFDAALSLDGQGFRTPASDHVDSFTAKAHGHVPDGAIVIADPNLIFHGEFKRTGVDLVLSRDGHDFVVHDYFRGDKRAAIASPDGAHLTGDIVSALTGYVQVAQAAPGAATAQVIGHVTKLTGSATAIRNGVSVILNNGDNVEKGDVVSTGSDSTLGITFIDGTVFGLSSNARMVLNEMVYDPNGSNNSSLLSLVAGTITFVAGDTAKHGDMKIDTPVATMGIRGTAVLTEINFVVPPGGGDPQPQANFQVLVEPNGTTGSYILFDKLTLLPIATVNQAGQMIQISGGNVSVTNALLSPDVQKLITDVFTLKFTDNNTNTKLTTNFTDTITQNGNIVIIKTDTGATATATFTNTVNNGTGPGQGGTDKGADRFPGPPDARTLDANGNVTTAFATTEHAAATGDRADATGAPVPSDTITIRVTFVDQNLGDRPTVSVSLDASNYTYKDAGDHDVTASLTALQKQDIAATQVQIAVAADGGNNNNGSAVLTYTVPDHVFDFLAAGETLTLTYNVSVNNNFAVQPEAKTIPITITITGTNDKPVIATSVPTITFAGGTSVPGGPLTSDVPTSGTLTFNDVDLTDAHTVSVSDFSAVLPGGTVPTAISDFLAGALLVSIGSGDDSTGTGTGTVTWSLKDIPVYLADFIPQDEVLTLTYTVTVTDSQGATSNQTITVTITGTDAPAVVWIATNAPSGGFWKDGANWETGTVPTINDDVIVITDQLHGLTPSYPVTIDLPAFGKSLTMDDYDTTADHTAPEVINHSTLTLAGTLTLNADAKLTNAAHGTVFVGGAIDVETITRKNGDVVVNTAAIANAGTLTLAAGGKIASLTTIANSGTIELSGGTLALNTSIANDGGGVQVDSVATLVADTVTVDGGTLTILGTLELDGTSLIENGTLNNSGAVNVKGAAEFANEIVDNVGGTIEIWANDTLTLNGVTISGGAVEGDGSIDVTGASRIDGGATLSASAVTVESDATLTFGDATVSTGAIDNGGTVEVEADETLTFAGATLTGGTLAITGTLETTGTSAIDSADTTVATTGTISVTSGTLTIDPGTLHAITNHGLIEAVTGGTLNLTTATIGNADGTISVDGTSKLFLTDVSINGGSLTNAGNLYSAGLDTVTGGVTNTGVIEVQGGTLNLSGGLTGAGKQIIIDDEATLELAGADAQAISFAGGTSTLQLDKVAGQSFTGTIAGTSSQDGTFTITGTADISTSLGDALDFTASGGTSDGGGGNIVLTPTGTLAGHDNGIVVTQDGIGDISLTTVGDITGQTGSGIVLHDGVNGAGGITATIGGGVTGAVGLDVVSHGDGDVTITNNGDITGTASFGIDVDQNDSGAAGATHVVNHGNVVGADGVAAISIQENDANAAVIDNSGIIGPADADTVTSTTYAIVEAGGAVTINNTGHINGNISVASATFNNEAGGTWTVAGSGVFGDASSIVNHGDIDLHGASISGTGLSVENDGGIDSWGAASIAGDITNADTGLIEVHAGTLTLFGSLTGSTSGAVVVDAGATLEVKGAVSQTVTLAGDGAELEIDTQHFGGAIADLTANDKIDLTMIKWGLGTTADYVPNADDPASGGVLTVTGDDGATISLTLVGDYRDAHFAGSDESGHTLITIHADDDAPALTTDGATLTANVSELADTTNSPTLDPSPAATGSIAFTDIDLTDRPTATITDGSATWLAAGGHTQLTLTSGQASALENALSVLTSGKNNGTADWSYSIADSALDFLARGQTATVISTITLDDHHGGSDTAQVTVTVAGANDAPTLADTTLPSVAGNQGDPAGHSFSDLFQGKFADVDDGGSLQAIAVTSDTASSSQGVWQYELADTGQWVDIGSVSDTHALVLDPGTLVRFVPANGFTGTPDPLGVHALDDTYTGGITSSASPVTTDITVMDADGTASVSHQAATIGTSVTAPVGGPVIDTTHFYVVHDGELGTDTIFNLSVTDTDSGASTDDFTVTATTAHAPGSSVDLSPTSGSLADINTAFTDGVTYSGGVTPPDTDQIAVTVTDKTTGLYDTVNFIFNEGDASNGVTLTGTSGKDVIFATTTGDTLTGGDGKDQFVFAPGSSGGDATHTVTDFIEGLDTIDLRQFSGVSSIGNLTIVQQQTSADTLVTWSQQISHSAGPPVTENEQLLLKNVIAANLKASDFIFHVT
ncbi:FecR domain-containing protein [Bradyrhizobium sp. CCBAU 53338]|uniref:FecR domain-containing protein n=1 Tax=Bradyrhizobium sp. CCBAU 53338 TaxID=1325111 RepID=UPI00188AF7CA|nr:FecR domain-containing protein [Bradyrhizobium sp. CCBAU 53338]QOZ55572.1 hypothetical protein XH90_32505 [Bradyrhizobium sp. CCBAU 53338]